MNLTALSSVSSFLSVLVPISILVGFIWMWKRTESIHVLLHRIWRLLHGRQPITDPEINAYIEEQTSLMSFRFLTGVQVKTLASARQLIKWSQFHEVEIKTIARCGDYFDPDLRAIRVHKLPSPSLQKMKILLLVLISFTGLMASMGIVTNDALLQFKATNHWFFMKSAEASVIWPVNAESLKKSDCRAEVHDNAHRTSFSESEVQLICTMFTSPEKQDYIQIALTTQRLAFAYVLFVFTLLAWLSFWDCMKSVMAKDLLKRRLNPDITGGQGALSFNEN